MKVAIVYDPKDGKLLESSYSACYKGMFESLLEMLGTDVVEIHDDCNANEIDADVILFWDVHSIHDIKIKNIDKHPAIKYEYMDDPHQPEYRMTEGTGRKIHKPNAFQRMTRAKERGVSRIVCPYREGYLQYLSQYAWKDGLLFWFPVAPKAEWFTDRHKTFDERKHGILANGATKAFSICAYEFRTWVYSQNDLGICKVPHGVKNPGTPTGDKYGNFLAKFKASFALHKCYPVPKYMEVPLAGCLPIMEWNIDAYDLGFRHGQTCIYVDKMTLKPFIKRFKSNPKDFEMIARRAQRLVENKYTSVHFANYLCRQFQIDSRS